MNPEDLATCQCIISHPSKPKFMAIKHTTGFLPPQVKVPMDFNIAGGIAYVLEAVREKYGLNTIALRHIAKFRDYQCIELELLGKGSRPLQAVWVGLEDYKRARGRDRVQFDPLAEWLEEKATGIVPAMRAPWERPSWYKGALHWIDFQLDQLNFPRTGTVVQHQALLHSGSILRVPTSRGDLFFKAAYEKSPREVPLTRYLAKQWPELVTEVLAHDSDRNWMLMPDYARDGRHTGTPADCSKAAAALAQIQLESANVLQELKGLGCQLLGLAELKSFLEKSDPLDGIPRWDEGGITDAERGELASLAPTLVGSCDRLAEYELPETLIHPDFRAANFFLSADSVRIIDWGGCSVGHPFFSLMQLLQENQDIAFEGLERDPVVQAYLRAFQAFESQERLMKALKLVSQLRYAWQLFSWSLEFPFLEPRTVSMVSAQRKANVIALQLLKQYRDNPAQFLAD